jgi:hypothetical protein
MIYKDLNTPTMGRDVDGFPIDVCAAIGGEAVGDAAPRDPVTVCCLP